MTVDFICFFIGFIFCMLADVALSICNYYIQLAHFYARRAKYYKIQDEKENKK